MFPRLKSVLTANNNKEKPPIQPQPLYPTHPGAYGPVLPNPNITTQPIFENVYSHPPSQYKYIEVLGQDGRKISIPYHPIAPNNHYPHYLTSQIINDQPKKQSSPYIQPQPQLHPQARAADPHMEPQPPQAGHSRPAFIVPPQPSLNTIGK